MAYREGIMEHTLRSHLQQLSSILSPVRTARMSSLQQFWEFDPAGMASIPLLASTQSWKSAERLALGLLSHWTALAAVEKLNERQRQILDTALRSAGDTDCQSLVPKDQAFEATLSNLEILLDQILLVTFPRGYYWSVGEVWAGQALRPNSRVGVPALLRAPLAHAINLWRIGEKARSRALADSIQMDAEDLARLVGIDVSISRQYMTALPHLVAANLRIPGVINRILGSLSVRSRRIFEEVSKAGDLVKIENLLAGQSDPDILPVLIELGESGLLLPAYSGGKRACFVHEEIIGAAAGRQPVVPPVTRDLAAVPTPLHVTTMGVDLWWNMMVAARWIAGGDASLTQAGTIPKRSETKLGKEMSQNTMLRDSPDFSVVRLTLTYLSLAGAIEFRDRRIGLTDQWDHWLKLGIVGQAATLFGAWLVYSVSSPDEFFSFPGLDRAVNPWLGVRRRLILWLRDARPGEWYLIHDLLQMVRAREPFCLRPRERILKTLGEAGIYDLHQSWDKQEGALILSSLMQLPFDSGLIELGWNQVPDTGTQPTHFRVTDLGDRLFNRVEYRQFKTKAALVPDLKEPEPDPRKCLVVQPNGEVLLMEFDPRVAYSVAQFARPVKFDRVGFLQICAESVRLAAGRGITGEQMLETLSRFCDRPVPQNVEYEIRNWTSSVKTVRFERATVIELDRPEDLDGLLATKAMKGRLRRRLSPTTALMSLGEDITALGKALEPEGFHWHRPNSWEKQEIDDFTVLQKVVTRAARR